MFIHSLSAQEFHDRQGAHREGPHRARRGLRLQARLARHPAAQPHHPRQGLEQAQGTGTNIVMLPQSDWYSIVSPHKSRCTDKLYLLKHHFTI